MNDKGCLFAQKAMIMNMRWLTDWNLNQNLHSMSANFHTNPQRKRDWSHARSEFFYFTSLYIILVNSI